MLLNAMGFHLGRAFGLTLATDEPLRGLAPHDAGTPDVRVHLHSLPAWFDPSVADGPIVWTSRSSGDRGADEISVRSVVGGTYRLLSFGDGMAFLISREGDEVWTDGPPGFRTETAETYLLGPVIGFVLRLRGTLCLHASVVQVGVAAVAIAGPGGAGKSTTAAALALRGHVVLADDIAALHRRDGRWMVDPGVGVVRLWDESVQMLFGRSSALPLMAPPWPKRYLDVESENPRRSCSGPVPLAAVYVLNAARPFASDTPRLSERDALLALVGSTYANVLLDPTMRAAEFKQLSRLVASVPVRIARPPGARDRLEALCDSMIHDVRAHE